MLNKLIFAIRKAAAETLHLLQKQAQQQAQKPKESQDAYVKGKQPDSSIQAGGTEQGKVSTNTPTLMPAGNRQPFFDGLRSAVHIPYGTTPEQWDAGGPYRNTADRTIGTTSVHPSKLNQYTKTDAGALATPKHAARRMYLQAILSGHGIGATPLQAKIMGMLLGRMRTINHHAGGSANVKPGAYGALTPQLLQAARAWYGFGAEMSDELAQKWVLALARLLANNKAQQQSTGAYGSGVASSGTGIAPA